MTSPTNEPKTAEQRAEEIIVFVSREQAKPYDTVVRITPFQLSRVENALKLHVQQEGRELVEALEYIYEKHGYKHVEDVLKAWKARNQ